MWSLNTKNENRIFYINQSVIPVGRNCEGLKLPDDKSVSRNHATLYHTSSDELILQDLNSKYGTFIRMKDGSWRQLNLSEKLTLSPNDTIRFGCLNNHWTIVKMKISTYFSTMKPTQVMLNLLNKMKVSYTDSWSTDSTHLTMPNITLTLKVVYALVCLHPIVTPDYWRECLKCFENNLPLPDESDFLPLVGESTLNQQTVNFKIDVKRKTLFLNKSFIFLSQIQLLQYKPIIETAGGSTVYMNDFKTIKTKSCMSDYIIIQMQVDELSQNINIEKENFDELINIMTKKGYRIIPETEIGLAILSVSLEKYCNPLFNFAIKIMDSENKQMKKHCEILAPETQEFEKDFLSTLPEKIKEQSKNLPENKNQNPSCSNSMVSSNSLNSEKSQTSQLNISIKNNCKKRCISPSYDEPTKKICMTEENINTPNSHDNEIFKFLTHKSSDSKILNKNLLNIKPHSRKNKNIQNDNLSEENLFNFLPENPIKEIKENCCKKIKYSLQSSDVNNKRLCLREENITTNDSKKNDYLIKSIIKSPFHNKDFEKSHWVSSKDPSNVTTIKLEKSEMNTSAINTDYVENKLKELDLKPITIIVNKNLIKGKKETNVKNNNYKTLCNYKKFVKIKPVRPQSEIITRDKLLIFHNLTKQMNNMNDDDDEEKNLQFHFNNIEEFGENNIKHKKRRL